MKIAADNYQGATIDYGDGYVDFERELLEIFDGLNAEKRLWITVTIKVLEETGVETLLESVVALGQFFPVSSENQTST